MIVFGGHPRQLVEEVLQEGYRIVVSAEILSEVRRVMNHKFPNFTDDFETLLVALGQYIVTVKLGSVTITICRDPDDNKILETAIVGRVQAVISGDGDLLVLHSYEGIAIKSPSEWLSR